ncbi:MAG: type IX secretion system membrane protein PorP/SprF [Bacteroidales bacterium]|nr:type IX secretion system membrane protein PorP/SprF [Bacteroidales bacterium]
MDLKPYISVIKKVLSIFIFTFSFIPSNGQQMPFYPLSYRVFDPFIFNPAIAGSKDFFDVDLLLSKYDKSYSQMVSGNLRLIKSKRNYYSSSGFREFKNIGLGGSIFNDQNGLNRNIGIIATGAYHFQLDKNALSFLSVGISAKAVSNHYSGEPDQNKPAKNTIFPNFDAGVYYYSTHLFTGVSATNLLGNPGHPDNLGLYAIPVSRQLFFQIGYKIVLSRTLNVLLEPSVICNSDDSFSGEVSDMIKPELKLYADNIVIGTYFNDYEKTSFFFQYRYPKFHFGAYFEFPNDSPFYKNPLLIEVSLGLNLSVIKSEIRSLNHW